MDSYRTWYRLLTELKYNTCIIAEAVYVRLLKYKIHLNTPNYAAFSEH